MKQNKTAGKTAKVAQCEKNNKQFTDDGDLIYRPKHYPFEIVTGFGYVVQTRLFTQYKQDVETMFLAKDGDETIIPECAKVFDDAKSAAKAAAKVAGYPKEQEDGNCYPRVLKVRLSWIVEGVAFESVVRDIKGGEKLEGVA